MKNKKTIFQEFDGLEMKFQKDSSVTVRDGKKIFHGAAADVEKFLIEKGVITKKKKRGGKKNG